MLAFGEVVNFDNLAELDVDRCSDLADPDIAGIGVQDCSLAGRSQC